MVDSKDTTPVPKRPDSAAEAASARPDPTGQKPDNEDYDVVGDHAALQNQGSTNASRYPKSDREAQSLVTPKK